MREPLGLRIRLARTRRGLTQTALAELIGVSRNTMSLIERGATDPGFSRVQKMAEVMRTSLDYLGGKKDDDSESEPLRTREAVGRQA